MNCYTKRAVIIMTALVRYRSSEMMLQVF